MLADESQLDLALARQWWLPKLQIAFPERAQVILLDRIRRAQDPFRAAMVFGGRENWISPEILEVLLDQLRTRLSDALASPPDHPHRLVQPLAFLARVNRSKLLEIFRGRRGSALAADLSAWLCRKGAPNGRWVDHELEYGLSVLRKIGGGIAVVANRHLTEGSSYSQRQHGFNLALRDQDSRTVELLKQIAFQDREEALLTGSTAPLEQSAALATLAALQEDRTAIRGVVRWGLRLARSVWPSFDGRVLCQRDLEPALSVMRRNGDIAPGAVLALGLGRRPALEDKILAAVRASEPGSELALAAILALDWMRSRSPDAEDFLRRGLAAPEHRFAAVRALLRLDSPAARAALLTVIHGPVEKDYWTVAQGLLKNRVTRNDVAGYLWGRHGPSALGENLGSALQHLSVLHRQPDVEQFLRDAAWRSNDDPFFALRAILEFDPDDAYQAARFHLDRLDPSDRPRIPAILLESRRADAIPFFKEAMRSGSDLLVLHSMAEVLDRHRETESLRLWMEDGDARLRQGTCLACRAVAWKQELAETVHERCRDRDWNVRDAAWPALERLWLQRDAESLVAAAKMDADPATRWSLLDAAVELGYPGVNEDRFPEWTRVLWEADLPFLMNERAVARLTERAKELAKELTEEKRPG